jgi:hypothetical protein
MGYKSIAPHGRGPPGSVETQSDRLPALAADLVGRNVDVIIAMGGTPSTIPIVFLVSPGRVRPRRYPTTFTKFATEAEAEAWITRHKIEAQSNALPTPRFRRARGVDG